MLDFHSKEAEFVSWFWLGGGLVQLGHFVKTLCLIHTALPVSVEKYTKTRWSLLSSVGARGSKSSHVGKREQIYIGLTELGSRSQTSQ